MVSIVGLGKEKAVVDARQTFTIDGLPIGGIYASSFKSRWLDLPRNLVYSCESFNCTTALQIDECSTRGPKTAIFALKMFLLLKVYHNMVRRRVTISWLNKIDKTVKGTHVKVICKPFDEYCTD